MHLLEVYTRFGLKGVSIQNYSDDAILMMFADEINALVRKRLHYQTSEELFEEYLDRIYALHLSSALD